MFAYNYHTTGDKSVIFFDTEYCLCLKYIGRIGILRHYMYDRYCSKSSSEILTYRWPLCDITSKSSFNYQKKQADSNGSSA